MFAYGFLSRILAWRANHLVLTPILTALQGYEDG